MSDIIHTILETEKECAKKIEACMREQDAIIEDLSVRLESKRKDETKQITSENSSRLKKEIENAEEKTRRKLLQTKSILNRLRENRELCNEVRGRIRAIIF
ncbi:MAG: hypothetical protein JXA07_06155 [Spirochaetes bacterium]|nr:hypothetical protein [Spirochaetota bacterium]